MKNLERMRRGHWLSSVVCVPFSALMWLVGWQEGHRETCTTYLEMFFSRTSGRGELAVSGSAGRRLLKQSWIELNNNNNSNATIMFMVLHSHCESSPGSFDECRLSAGWPPTLRPSQPTWAVSLPISSCYHPHPQLPFLIITQPECWYSFYCPTGLKAEST